MKVVKFIFKLFSVLAKILVLIGGVNLVFTYIEERVHHKVPEGGRYFDWKHGKIFYHKRGKGSPVILLHGFEPQQSGKDIESLSRHLSTNHTVYRIDLLGFGLSEKPWVTYTNFLYVLMLQDFIKNVVGDVSDVIACGGSCLFTLQAYRNDPSLIGKVVLVDPIYEKDIKVSPRIGSILRQIIDAPVFGTFIYNLYSLTGAAPFDKEGRHVFTSRLAGYLTSDLTGHEHLFSENVAVFNHSAKDADFTFGDVKSSLV